MEFRQSVKTAPVPPTPIRQRILALVTLLAVLLGGTPALAETLSNNDLPRVRVMTTEGSFEIRLRPDIAPKTVANFLAYVDQGFYEGTLFHRVIPGFMIQGGGFDRDMRQKTTGPAIPNESRQTARNLRGTIAMARTNNPDSATAQFFINLVDNPHLNAQVSRPGYAVFGTVTEGMGTIDAIGGMPTTRTRNMSDVPATPVVIESIRRVDSEQ